MATKLTLRNWMFTGPGNDFVCPTWTTSFKCNPTAACASDNATGRQYCCEDQQGMCWNQAATCATDGSTFNCTRGTSSWCCMTNTEICTEIAGQINICWAANPRNVLLDITPNALKSAYSSLTAGRPSASSYTFDPQLLMAATTSPSSSSSTSRVTDAAQSSPTTSSPSTAIQTPTNRGDTGAVNSGTTTPSPNDGGGLGAGAIAGIVVGVLLAIAFGAALAWFLMRKKKRQNDDIAGAGPHEVASTHASDQKYMYAGSSPGYAEAHSSTVEEMPTPVHDYNNHSGVLQVAGGFPAAHQHYYAELPADAQGRAGAVASPQT
ncbi:hypothetical protein B0T14DRAFT_525322 [Immersiella caudata]|uniref:Uncharacterized protein n=1 Tax=Immersiella caudata TaxID=314043 RepID=A0AA39WLD4_9PEZI|nr:hypothetical protein B0T14DRAFT_525322 [Immersiella caudata]